MIDEQSWKTERSGILYDASTLRKPHEEMFSKDYWRARDALSEMPGGRGSIAFVRSDEGEWVLRHYKRGGRAAKVSSDGYLWMGADRTRCFREWRLLAELHGRGLPVPRPIGARFVRGGLVYRADLITERIPDARTLADLMSAAALTQADWLAVGGAIAEFHRHGVHHADLNAQNILLSAASQRPDGGPRVFVLDFDQGRLRAAGGTWEQRVLARLRRSLDKVQRQVPRAQFSEPQWQWHLEGYRTA